MKIVAIETHLIRVPCDIGAAPTAFLGVGWSSLDTLLVRVVTDQGLEGWGEGFGHACCPATRIVVDTQLAPAVLGEDARDIRGLMARLAQRLHLFGRNGPHVYALSALDVALWDIAGKAANLPLWRLLGGAPLGALPAYASLLRYSAPAEVAKACARALDQGYRAVKLHEIDVPQTRAARDAVGPTVSLMLDVELPLERRQRNRHGPSSTGLRSGVAGGASLAAGAPRGSCPCPPRGRRADRGRRERGEPVRGPGNAGRQRGRHHPAERGQDRRHHRSHENCRCRGGNGRSARAALRVFRTWFSGLTASGGRTGAGSAIRTVVRRSGSEPLSRSCRSQGRALSPFPTPLASVAIPISTSFAAMRFRRQPFCAPDGDSP